MAAVEQVDAFFVEKAEAFAALRRFLDEAGGGADLYSHSQPSMAPQAPVERQAALPATRALAEGGTIDEDPVITLCSIIERYQEQPHLLDVHLPGIVCPLMYRARDILRTWYAQVMAAPSANGAFPYQIFHSEYLLRLFTVVYTCCKTRGYKPIVRLFPHEVADLEPAVHALVCQDVSRHDSWQVRYVLFLWLSILVLVPFDLKTIDSSLAASAATSSSGLIATLLRMCKLYLADAGAVRDAAAVCVAKLLTRPDMDREHLYAYMFWTTRVLDLLTSNAAATTIRVGAATAAVPSAVDDEQAVIARELLDEAGLSLTPATRSLLTTGIMQSLVEIAKNGHREGLREALSETFERVIAITDADAAFDSGAGTHSSFRNSVLRASPLLRKLTVKLATRTGLTHLPPRVVAWRYQRGQRSLLQNLSQAGVAAAKERATKLQEVAGGVSLAAPAHRAQREPEEAGDVEDTEVPFQMDDIIDMLLNGLRDSDTVVRWSAAKGIGRTTGRLPHYLADQVVEAVVTLLDPTESDGAWHGGCLALAELARRGLLLPERLPTVIPLVLAALAYDVRKGAHSVGQHVRDAACYVCWAFARAYAPTVMRPHVTALAQGMLITALFDREVNCRRAASAAFQENVGRQGHENFPNGIEILTCADYFSLGNRANAYAHVAPRVARFHQYRYALLQHLLTVKLRHWDRHVRSIAARSLGGCAHLDPHWAVNIALATLIPETTSSELVVRHGATMAIGEIVLALSQVPVRLSTDTLDAVRNVIVKAEKARAYTGRGGELVRAAMCRLVEAQCLAAHPISRKAALRMLQSLDDCLKHPNEAIQAAAVSALRALTRHALNEADPALVERLPKTYVQRLMTDDNPAMRRGMCLALGALPRVLLCSTGVLNEVLHALITASKMERQVAQRDAETRRNAVIALGHVTCTVGLGTRRLLHVESGRAPVACSVDSTAIHSHVRTESLPGLTPGQFRQVWRALLCATHDYATDNRGDVGSWVRKAALESLETLVYYVQTGSGQHHFLQTLLAGGAALDSAGVAHVSSVALPSLAPAARWVHLHAAPHAMAASHAQVAGYGHISGYAPGTLTAASSFTDAGAAVSANGLVVGCAVRTVYGIGELASVSGAGAVAHVRFARGTLGAVYFPYGIGMLPARKCTAAGTAASAHVLVLEQDPATYLEADCVHDVLGALLRQLGEKLDLLRGVAGEMMCRILHLPSGVPALDHVPHRAALEAAFPRDTNLWTQESALHDVIEDEEAAAGGEHEDAGLDADAAGVTGSGALMQWSLPHQTFPRLAPLLNYAEFAPHIMEGLITSVGGLSESVVKHSSNALSAWAVDAKATHDIAKLAFVVRTTLGFCKPRARQEWDELVDGPGAKGSAAAGGAVYTPSEVAPGAHDPSMSRWFKAILGSSAAGGRANRPAVAGDSKMDARLVTPAMRTLEALLGSGACSVLQGGEVDVGVDIVDTLRKRVQSARDDAPRILAATGVLMNVLSFDDPVRTHSMLLLLDLLCHPFPRIRKATAERLYVRLLTLEDVFAARPATGAEPVSYEGALSLVAETPWDADLHQVVPFRDRLYAALGVAAPTVRSGLDGAMFASAAASLSQERVQAGEDETSYGNLVREMGY